MAHIPNFTDIAHPFHEALRDEKIHGFLWTPELDTAFSAAKEAVVNCQKLFFVRDDLPVYLHTDASNYGIGAYLFQADGEIHFPIRFISKTLSEAQQKWNTTEKELYAIIYALKKLDYLLRDTKFVLCTDHKNLTYVDKDPRPRVQSV